MGVCTSCNGNAGWLSHECSNCRAKREAVEAAQAEAARQAAEVERRAQLDSMVEAALLDLKARTDAGATVQLYECLELPLDENGWIDATGLDRLRELGERGWQVVLGNRHVRAEHNFDAAITGLVLDNTQLLVALAVSSTNAAHLDSELRAYFAARAGEDLDAR